MAGKSLNEKSIYESLISQIKAQNKETAYSLGKINEYMESVKIVKKLTADIRKRGVTVCEPNSRGDKVTKSNPSIKERQRELAAMNSIIQLFGLQNPVRQSTEDDYM